MKIPTPFRCTLSVLALLLALVITNGYGSGLNLSGNYGTSFVFSVPPVAQIEGSHIVLNVVSIEDCYVTATVVAKGWQKVIAVKALVGGSMEVPPDIACAYIGADTLAKIGENVLASMAIEVTATKPISLRCQYRGDYTGEAFLVLPIVALGTDYVVSSMADMSWMYGGTEFPSYCTISAVRDNTIVTITLGGPSINVSVGGMKPGQTKTITMMAGDVVVLSNAASAKEGDVSGTLISANNPIAVVSGNMSANVPVNEQYGNYLAEMELPIKNWNLHYQVPRNSERLQGYFMKVYSAKTNNKLYYNCAYWKTIQKVGGQEGSGWIYQRVDGTGNNVLSLQGDGPFNVSVYNPGSTDDNVACTPFSMVLSPVEQYSNSFIFSLETDNAKGYAHNCIGLIFPLDSNKSMPADLQIAVSDSSGAIRWTTVAAMFGASFSTKDIYDCPVNGVTYAFKELLATKSGVYALRCSQPFMCYVYGDSKYFSYGHAAGLLGKPENWLRDSVAPRVTVAQNGRSFFGIAHDLPEDSTLRSNLMSISLASSSYNVTLNAPKTYNMSVQEATWTVTVIDSNKDAFAILMTEDWAGNQTLDTLRFLAIEDHAPSLRLLHTPVFCAGTTVSVSLALGPYKRVEWSTGDIGDTLQLSSSTAKTVNVYAKVTTPGSKTYYSDTLTITFIDRPTKPVVQIVKNTLVAPIQAGLLYSWYFNGAFLVSGAEMTSVPILSLGRYKLRVTDTHTGCFTESDEIDVTTMDVQLDADARRIYPQPARDVLYLDVDQTEVHDIALRTVLGQLLDTRVLASSGSKIRIDLRELPAGLYLLEWYEGSQLHRQAFVISN